MGFLDSYKHLEKICGEIMKDERKVSAYIEEMQRIFDGPYYVKSWNDDLKQLKHYRWIRNQIVHEPTCTEAAMCVPEDTAWLDGFYTRIMEQTDPLALYYKAIKSRNTVEEKRNVESQKQTDTRCMEEHRRTNPTGIVLPGIILVSAMLFLAFVIVGIMGMM